MSASKAVLILAADATAAALLGMLAELARYAAVYPAEAERPEEALTRLRPAVVLLDASLAEAQSDLFFRGVAKRRVGLAMFGAGEGAAGARHASRQDVPYAAVPRSVDQFVALVDAALAGRQRRIGSRRGRGAATSPPPDEPGRTERDGDGTLIFHDLAGQRWRVYDRRGGDRRRTPGSDYLTSPTDPPAGAEPAGARGADEDLEPGARDFVGENGDTWRYALSGREVHALTASDLGRQLALAMRV